MSGIAPFRIRNTSIVLDADGATTATLTKGAVEGLIASGAVQEVDVTIPGGTGAGHVGSLHGTPVQVVAAPAAGKWIDLQGVEVMLDYGTAAYDGVGAGEKLGLYYNGGALCSQEINGVGFADQASDQHRAVGRADSTTPLAATAIVAEITSDEWYAAAGDSPLKIRVRYIERTLLT